MTKRTWVTLLSLALAAGVHAQQWTASVGVNYRSFDDIEMHEQQFSNSHDQYDEYVNGLVNVPTGFVVIEHVTNQFNPPGFVPGQGDDPSENVVNMDRVTFSGDDDSDSGAGVVIEAARSLQQKTRIPLSFVLSLTTANLAACNFQPGVVMSDAYQIDDSGGGPGLTSPSPFASDPTDLNSAHYPPPGDVAPDGAPGSGTASTYGSMDYDIDMDAFTLGAGLSGRFCFGQLNILFGAGPTLTIADINVDADETVRWIIDDSAVYSRRRSDDSTQIRFGAYANIGLQMAITERLAVAAEYRYDCATEAVTTDLADVDLNGESGQLKLTYSF